ncbi:unnamed protein product, partial [Sphagnum compactum]
MSEVILSRRIAIAWFRNDLRIFDNVLLTEANSLCKSGRDILCVYCFDPRHFGATSYSARKCEKFRAQFLLESVQNLRNNLQSIQSDLLVACGKPEDVLTSIVRQYGEDSVVLVQKEHAQEEMLVEKRVASALAALGGSLRLLQTGSTLYHIDDLPYRSMSDMPDVFTPVKNALEKHVKIRDLLPALEPGDLSSSAGSSMRQLFSGLSNLPDKCGLDYLPAVADLLGPSTATADGEDISPPARSGVMQFVGGETAGRQRLQEWMWRDDNLKDYFDIRNGLLGERYSSKLSPWLALGCISPRLVAAEARRYERERVANKSTYWLVWELTCRDFFRFLFLKYGARMFYPGGAKKIDVSARWARDPGDDVLARWTTGRTGVPIVDANMRELSQTGWMSNRGRQIVASYLIYELRVDWRKGAHHFESLLIDHDVYSNYANWNAAAALTGGRVNRFNMAKQTADYDPRGEYIDYWLP